MAFDDNVVSHRRIPIFDFDRLQGAQTNTVIVPFRDLGMTWSFVMTAYSSQYAQYPILRFLGGFGSLRGMNFSRVQK